MSQNKMQHKEIKYLGGKDGERLYLKGLRFKLSNGQEVVVKKTNIPGINMPDLIARAKGRYALAALFSRPGYRVLDFPSGGGYSAQFLKEFGVHYEGMEVDPLTVEYSRRVYGASNVSFQVGDLCKPKLNSNHYDLICCIEGLEHVEQKYQTPLIAALYQALKPGGVLVISSPENVSKKSGRSADNPYHLWELSRKDFLKLMHTKFGTQAVQLLTYQAVLSYGDKPTTCFFGICRK